MQWLDITSLIHPLLNPIFSKLLALHQQMPRKILLLQQLALARRTTRHVRKIFVMKNFLTESNREFQTSNKNWGKNIPRHQHKEIEDHISSVRVIDVVFVSDSAKTFTEISR